MRRHGIRSGRDGSAAQSPVVAPVDVLVRLDRVATPPVEGTSASIQGVWSVGPESGRSPDPCDPWWVVPG